MLRDMRTATSTMTSTCDSPAKINLCLRIVGRRPDGYHLLDSIFAAIDLTDRLTISIANAAPRRRPAVEVRCPFPGVPTDGTNLVARAAVTLLDEWGLGADVSIEIDKRIPPGAGLGGGSSNAATVLRALPEMLSLEIVPARLHEIALGLGADVPFFLTGGCARVRGIGERVDPIPGWPGLGLVVALPPIAVSTAWAFRTYSGGFTSEPTEPASLAAAAVPTMELLRNDLESVVVPAHPVIGELKRLLAEAGSGAVVMSGSGAAVVGLVPPSTTPERLADTLSTRCPGVRFHGVRIQGTTASTTVDQPRSYA